MLSLPKCPFSEVSKLLIVKTLVLQEYECRQQSNFAWYDHRALEKEIVPKLQHNSTGSALSKPHMIFKTFCITN